MTYWVRVQDDVVTTEVLYEDPTGKYHPDIVWMEVPDYMAPYINGDYIVETKGSGKKATKSIVPPSAEYLQNQIKAMVANERWIQQIRGVTINGLSYPSTKDGIADIDSKIVDGLAYEAENGEGSFVKLWKVDGQFIDLTLENFQTIKRTISEYVDECYAYEALVIEGLQPYFDNQDYEGAIEVVKGLIEEDKWPSRVIS